MRKSSQLSVAKSYATTSARTSRKGNGLAVAKDVDTTALTKGKGLPQALSPHLKAVSESLPDVVDKMPPVSGVDSSFDGFAGPLVCGWAYDQREPDTKLTIELRCNGAVVARTRADKLRGDLRDAHKGDGCCGYQIETPPLLWDGQKHLVCIYVADTGDRIGPEEIEFCRIAQFRGGVDVLEGATVCGWVVDDNAPSVTLPVELLDFNKVIAEANADLPREMGHCAFRIPLPADALDGRPHLLTVRVKGHGHVVGAIADVTPTFLTPLSALQQFTIPSSNADRQPLARYRYHSLTGSIDGLSREHVALRGSSSDDQAAALRERLAAIVIAHGELVRGFQSIVRNDFQKLYLPVSKSPTVTVIVPVHNKFNVTYNGLAALVFAVTSVPFEVVLVDDGSEDRTREIEHVVAGLRVVRNTTAQGFLRSCNLGAQQARGEFVVLLNNDTEVTAYWLDELLSAFRRFERIGLAGSKLIFGDGRLQEAGGVVWNTATPWNYGRNANAADPRYNYVRQVDYVSGACIMLPTKLWNTLGGFDIAFAPAYYEDTDLAFRLRESGYRTIYVPQSVVVHYEGQSNGTDVAVGIKRYQSLNAPKFKARWFNSCRGNGNVGDNVELNKDRGVVFRCLVIDASTPRPDVDAGGYAAVQEMRLLQSLGMKVTFIPENLAYLGEYTEGLESMGIECCYAPFQLSVEDVLAKRGAEFDLIYVNRYYVADKFLDTMRRHAPGAKIVLMLADLHFLRELRMAIARSDHELIKAAVAVREAELRVLRAVDLVLSYSPIEQAVIQSHNLDSTRIALCPWVVDLPATVPSFGKREGIAFLGGYGHPPNLEAVNYFLQDIMPRLKVRLPEVQFHIYGSNIPDSLLKAEDDNVKVVGHARSVTDVYNKCRVFVAPLLTGAGLKGKVAGALAHGVPSVLSPIAVEGIAVRSGLEAFVAESPEKWVAAIVDLYTDEVTWKKVSAAARQFADEQYAFAHGRERMKQALDQVEIFCDLKTESMYSRVLAVRH